jgi:outer membrane receptor protein involved in Fe transport
VTILVDGQFAVHNQPAAQGYELDGSHETAGFGSGPDIDPNDVESVEVLKSAAARNAYGTCPGVALILITTKSKKWHPYTTGPK